MISPVKYTLSEVLAAAYPAGDVRNTLVHAVDAEGNPACKNVKPENLAEYAHPRYTAPTCPRCLKYWNAALGKDSRQATD